MKKIFAYVRLLKLQTLAFALFTLPVSSMISQAHYPISELGNCDSQAACADYCNIWSHTPICWSYQKYILKINVLGEATSSGTATTLSSLQFPITELGNCDSMTACAAFCDKPLNQVICTNYGKKMGLLPEDRQEQNPQILALAKQSLGCSDTGSCRSLCEQSHNRDRCVSFARAHGLVPPITEIPKPTIQPELFISAKRELGCGTREECATFCSQETYVSICHSFAVSHQLIKPTAALTKTPDVLEEAQKEFGCTSSESCSVVCSLPQNQPKCIALAKRFGKVVQIEPTRLPLPSSRPLTISPHKLYKEMSLQPSRTPTPIRPTIHLEPAISMLPTISRAPTPTKPVSTAGCTTETQCKEICLANPGLCPGFPIIPTMTPTSFTVPTKNPVSDFTTTVEPTVSPTILNRTTTNQPFPTKTITF